MTDAVSANQTTSSQGGRDTTTHKRTSPAGLLSQLRGNPRVPLLIAAAAVIAILIVLLMWARSPDYRVLYSNLSNADGGRIITELDTLGIPYEFGAGGSALLVPGDQVHTLRLKLAEQGLPEAGNVGFEIMDSQAFGISQFAEHINYQRGLEGELALSMQSLGPVQSARVHLAMAKPSVFVRESEPAKASVILTLQPGRTLGEGQVNAIVHMVSSSVPELAADNVTVVDQQGNLLSRDGSSLGGLDGTQLEYTKEVERSYQQRIEHILAPILGADNVRAQVAAQIDFSIREQTAETYTPNQAPNEAAIRSRQTSASYSGGDGLAMGVPGALTNTPPGIAPSPIDLGSNAEGEQAGEDQQQDQVADTAQTDTEDATPPSRLDRSDIVNYEVDHSVEHVQYSRGSVERLSVAVVVDYQETINDQGETVMEPLSDIELAQIQRLVRQAIGFSATRNDAVEVVNSPFTQPEHTVEILPWWQTPQALGLAMTLGRYLLVLIAALLLWFMVLRPLIKRQAPAQLAGPALRTPVPVGAVDSAEDEEDEAVETPRPRRRRSSAYEQNLKDAREMAQEDPRLIAMIVRSWINT
ncbi:flagellar M-ring protein FliF [Modicisalibacter muralis]|uniref:Flagellar M-ring protein n=1 Tax=Modicisalibacter muralis TaxID=119000 RepID=A0A1G9FVB6_9GAMM|nr:flagellar basal-body MS-ring/collar protein FliF [Halomonas muralis]SDK92371.1 flagellar M-ring protein FliF [Halomonas muralis]